MRSVAFFQASFETFKEVCNYAPPYYVIVDKDFYESYDVHKKGSCVPELVSSSSSSKHTVQGVVPSVSDWGFFKRRASRDLEKLLEGEVKILMTICTIRGLIGRSGIEGFPDDMIGVLRCGCASQKHATECIKGVVTSCDYGSISFVGKQPNIFIATGQIPYYDELNVVPYIQAVHRRRLQLLFPQALDKKLKASKKRGLKKGRKRKL